LAAGTVVVVRTSAERNNQAAGGARPAGNS